MGDCNYFYNLGFHLPLCAFSAFSVFSGSLLINITVGVCVCVCLFFSFFSFFPLQLHFSYSETLPQKMYLFQSFIGSINPLSASLYASNFFLSFFLVNFYSPFMDKGIADLLCKPFYDTSSLPLSNPLFPLLSSLTALSHLECNLQREGAL